MKITLTGKQLRHLDHYGMCLYTDGQWRNPNMNKFHGMTPVLDTADILREYGLISSEGIFSDDVFEIDTDDYGKEE
jgi:hypothetical protein